MKTGLSVLQLLKYLAISLSVIAIAAGFSWLLVYQFGLRPSDTSPLQTTALFTFLICWLVMPWSLVDIVVDLVLIGMRFVSGVLSRRKRH